MRAAIRRFIGDTRGNFAIPACILMIVIIAMTALGVDVAKIFVDRRKAQSVADLAAISAATNLSNATAAAGATAQSNSYPPSAVTSVALGVYTANSSLLPSARFQPSASASANAVQVTISTSSNLAFGRLLIGRDSFPIVTKATATQTGFASFAIGSGLVSLNGGLLNQVLGGLLGTNLSLSAMDYQSLLSTNVDLFGFMNALASRANVTGGSYSSLLTSNVQVGTFIQAMIDTERAAGAGSQAISALTNIQSAVQGSTAKIPVGSLFNLGPYAAMQVGQSPQAAVTVTAMDMLSATAQVANGQHQIQMALNLSVPGITSASLAVAIGERPQGTSWVNVGTSGATVHTAQTRLLLTVQVPGVPGIASVSLPIYVEVASATATLTAVNCGYPDMSTSSVSLAVTPAVLDGWIGNVSSSDFTNFSSAPNPGPATLVNLALLRVTGLAHASISNLSPTTVSFDYSDIQSQTKKTVSTTDYLGSLVGSTVGNLNLTVSVGGLGLGLPGLPQQAVAQVVQTAVAPVDQELASVLAALGVQLGQGTVWVNGIRCDGAILVQ